MKYYSEEVVKKIITDATDAMRCGMEISRNVPISSNRYPSIEIPDKHGRIIDEKWVELYILKYFPVEFPNEMEKVYKLLKLALEDVPTVLEASR